MNLFRRFHRVPSHDLTDNGHQNRLNRTSRLSQISRISAVKPILESSGTLRHCRKRDRLRAYLARRRDIRRNESLRPYLWPAMLSADKEDDRSSNDTEDGDDMYMVEFRDDLESGDELFSRGGYVTPPVEIPEMYQRQDRFGGITVAGARVVFTYAGFKRQQVIRVKLQTIFEGE